MWGPGKKLQAHVLPQLAMSSQCFERKGETSSGEEAQPYPPDLFLHVRLITGNPEILSGSECALEPRPVHCLQSSASPSSSPFISAGSPWISLACPPRAPPPQQYPVLDSSGPSCLQLQYIHHTVLGWQDRIFRAPDIGLKTPLVHFREWEEFHLAWSSLCHCCLLS